MLSPLQKLREGGGGGVCVCMCGVVGGGGGGEGNVRGRRTGEAVNSQQ